MYKFELTHRISGMTVEATGCNVYEALKNGGFDMKYWEVTHIERI